MGLDLVHTLTQSLDRVLAVEIGQDKHALMLKTLERLVAVRRFQLKPLHLLKIDLEFFLAHSETLRVQSEAGFVLETGGAGLQLVVGFGRPVTGGQQRVRTVGSVMRFVGTALDRSS